MILKDDFYTVVQLSEENNTIRATLELNAGHRIFEGHFPGQPVVPGVCMVQMVKELLETATDKRMLLKQSDHIKFLSVIDPTQHNPVQADIRYNNTENGEWEVAASLHCGETVCFKLKGVFVLSLGNLSARVAGDL